MFQMDSPDTKRAVLLLRTLKEPDTERAAILLRTLSRPDKSLEKKRFIMAEILKSKMPTSKHEYMDDGLEPLWIYDTGHNWDKALRYFDQLYMLKADGKDEKLAYYGHLLMLVKLLILYVPFEDHWGQRPFPTVRAPGKVFIPEEF